MYTVNTDEDGHRMTDPTMTDVSFRNLIGTLTPPKPAPATLLIIWQLCQVDCFCFTTYFLSIAINMHQISVNSAIELYPSRINFIPRLSKISADRDFNIDGTNPIPNTDNFRVLEMISTSKVIHKMLLLQTHAKQCYSKLQFA